MATIERVEIVGEEAKRIVDNLAPDAYFKSFARYGEEKYCMATHLFDNLGSQIMSMDIRPDDVWIASFPRSGTHWISELAWLIQNNLDFNKMQSVPHADRISFVELPRGNMDEPVKHMDYLQSLPSPRFLNTHLPLSLLPPSLLNTVKLIYVARDPRDVMVSYYKFPETKFVGSFKEFAEIFKDGDCMYTPYFANVKEYWRRRCHPNLLFLFYEDMHKDFPATVRSVAKFLNKELSDSEVGSLCSQLKFDNMKRHETVYSGACRGENVSGILRKGVAGGWREEFDEEMTKDVNMWIEDNLKGTDLKFPSIDL